MDEYEDTCRQLEAVLSGLVDEEGRALAQEVTRTAADAGSALGNPLPDLVVRWQFAALASPLRIRGSQVQAPPVGRKSTGQHASEGFCIYRGRRPWGGDGVVAAKDLGRVMTASLGTLAHSHPLRQ